MKQKLSLFAGEILTDNGKPVERRRRKATGPYPHRGLAASYQTRALFLLSKNKPNRSIITC